jgi:PAS domain-containing protein
VEPDTQIWRKHRETLDAHLPFRDFELARPTRDGGKRYVSVSGLPMFDKAGRFAGYRGVGRDITERKRGEQALRESEEQWKAVFENNPTMYFMVDVGGAIVSVNPLGAEQLGFTVDELRGLPVQNLVSPGAPGGCREKYSHLFRTTRANRKLGGAQNPQKWRGALGSRNGQGDADQGSARGAHCLRGHHRA